MGTGGMIDAVLGVKTRRVGSYGKEKVVLWLRLRMGG